MHCTLDIAMVSSLTVAAMNTSASSVSAPPVHALDLSIGGMTCASCVGRVERALRKVPGVQEATVNLATESARIQFAPPDGGDDAAMDALLRRAVRNAGYEPLTAAASQAREEDTSPWTGFAPVAIGLLLSAPLAPAQRFRLLGSADLHALPPLAWRVRGVLPAQGLAGVYGPSGSGKSSILRAAAPDAYLATQGNLNNEIGVPLTLLRLNAQHQLAVVELGMNHPGEIARLAAMAQPSVALVNNAQREHQEFMATVQAVALENGAVLRALSPRGTAVFPAGDDYSALWQELAGARPCLRFALQADAGADVSCSDAR